MRIMIVLTMFLFVMVSFANAKEQIFNVYEVLIENASGKCIETRKCKITHKVNIDEIFRNSDEYKGCVKLHVNLDSISFDAYIDMETYDMKYFNEHIVPDDMIISNYTLNYIYFGTVLFPVRSKSNIIIENNNITFKQSKIINNDVEEYDINVDFGIRDKTQNITVKFYFKKNSYWYYKYEYYTNNLLSYWVEECE